MPIKLMQIGEERRIVRLSASEKVKKHLENIGFAVGQNITVLSVSDGAVIVKVKEGRIAIDKILSAGIFVA